MTAVRSVMQQLQVVGSSPGPATARPDSVSRRQMRLARSRRLVAPGGPLTLARGLRLQRTESNRPFLAGAAGDAGRAVGLKSLGRTQDLASLPSSFFTAAHKVQQAKARLAAKVLSFCPTWVVCS